MGRSRTSGTTGSTITGWSGRASEATTRVIVVGTGLAGASAAATLAGQGLPGRVVLLPGLGPPRALDRRPGRDQRDQGLRQRGRLDPPALRRHDEGRRLPRARGERLAAGRDLDQHHRPGRRAGRAVQPRVRGHARHPLIRRRARRAHLLLPGPDRAAAAAGRLLGAPAPGRRGPRHVHTRHEMLDVVDRRWAGPRDHRPQPRDRRDRAPRRRRRRPRHRAATATSTTSPRTRWAATSPPPGARTAAAPRWRTRASPRSTPPRSRHRATTSRSSRS